MEKLRNEMHRMEARIKELDPEIDELLYGFVEKRLEYIYKRLGMFKRKGKTIVYPSVTN